MMALWLSSSSSYSYSSLKDVWYVSVVSVGTVCFESLTFLCVESRGGIMGYD